MKALVSALLAATVFAGCASPLPRPETAEDAAVRGARASDYAACLERTARSRHTAPAAVDDIAAAAHGACWSEWTAYREATHRSFARGTDGAAERQWAHDKAEAHLREFEAASRRSTADALVRESRQRPR